MNSSRPTDFGATQAEGVCAVWSDSNPDCATDPDSLPGDIEAPELPNLIGTTVARRIPSPEGGIRAGTGHTTATAQTITHTGTAVQVQQGTLVATTATVSAVATAVRQCYASPVLKNYVRVTIFEHPCDSRAVFSPGADMSEATNHDIDAIAEKPTRAWASYASKDDRDARQFFRTWYNAKEECNLATRAAEQQKRPSVDLACDELPHASTQQAGPGASLRLFRQDHNNWEGNALQQFYRVCSSLTQPPVSGSSSREAFIIAPVPASPRTVAYCRN